MHGQAQPGWPTLRLIHFWVLLRVCSVLTIQTASSTNCVCSSMNKPRSNQGVQARPKAKRRLWVCVNVCVALFTPRLSLSLYSRLAALAWPWARAENYNYWNSSRVVLWPGNSLVTILYCLLLVSVFCLKLRRLQQPIGITQLHKTYILFCSVYGLPESVFMQLAQCHVTGSGTRKFPRDKRFIIRLSGCTSLC